MKVFESAFRNTSNAVRSKTIPVSLCVRCKGGRNLCGLGYCPLLSRVQLKPKFDQTLKEEFFGPSTNVFVGRFGYPNVNVGPLSVIQIDGQTNLELIDDPAKWFGMPYEKIVEMRSLMMRSERRNEVTLRTRFVEDNQLLALAERPVDVELRFSKRPKYTMNFSDVHQPMGPTAPLREMRIVDNVKISKTVENVTADELKAREAMTTLYSKQESVYKIMSVLSSGALGVKKKLVPTRWSITVVDDTLSKHLLQSVRECPSINEYRVYESSFLYNDLCVLLMPGQWEYEAFESWAPGSMWAKFAQNYYMIEEYEPYEGRSDYASEMGGCYYSTRLAVAEALATERRQARCIAFREVRPQYIIPVGVWQVRENVRNAMKSSCKKFATLEEALEYISTKMTIPMDAYRKRSRLLTQKRLWDYTVSSLRACSPSRNGASTGTGVYVNS